MLTFLKSTLPGDVAEVPAVADPQPSPYVRTVVLEGLEEIGNPEAIWAQPRAFGFGLKPPRLRQVVDEAAFRMGGQALVPDSVVVELAAETVERDRRIGGQLGRELAQGLADLHAADFGNRLPPNKMPRYRIQPATDLPPGRLRVRLGPAIHVPQPTESLAWRVEMSLDGMVWDATPALELPEFQRLFILSGSAAHGSQVCPLWPFSPTLGLAMLNEPGAGKLELSAEPLNTLAIQYNAQGGWYVVRQAGGGANGPCLYLKVTRLKAEPHPRAVEDTLGDSGTKRGRPHSFAPQVPLPPQAPSQPVLTEPLPAAAVAMSPKAAAPSASGLGGRVEPVLDAVPAGVPGRVVPPVPPTALRTPAPASLDDAPTLIAPRAVARAAPGSIDDAPTLLATRPVPTARLVLQGLAVQRPSLFSTEGVTGLHWGLSATGQVVLPNSSQAVLRFEVTGQDVLMVHTRAGSRPLALGDVVPLPGGERVVQLQAVPEALADLYLGWLSLPVPVEARLVHGQPCTVGRQTDALRPLRPLSEKGFLPGLADAGGDRMGLSRQHVELQASPEGLRVNSLSQAPLMHLDDKMLPLGKVEPGRPALVVRGQHLVLGHYVWRYWG